MAPPPGELRAWRRRREHRAWRTCPYRPVRATAPSSRDLQAWRRPQEHRQRQTRRCDPARAAAPHRRHRTGSGRRRRTSSRSCGPFGIRIRPQTSVRCPPYNSHRHDSAQDPFMAARGRSLGFVGWTAMVASRGARAPMSAFHDGIADERASRSAAPAAPCTMRPAAEGAHGALGARASGPAGSCPERNAMNDAARSGRPALSSARPDHARSGTR